MPATPLLSRHRHTLALLGLFCLFWVVGLGVDTRTTLAQQALLGAATWAFLAIALWLESPAVRLQVGVLVGVATALECLGSIVWGAYTYRLGNLPLYVPAGHGLFYLVALRTAALPWLARHARAIASGVLVAATLWMLRGLVAPPLPDLLGFVTWAIFMRFMLRGRYPLLYALSFVLTMALEFYGTSLGVWRWSPLLPGLWLPAGNPPTGIGAGYCAMDALTRRIVASIGHARLRRRAAGSAAA
ncbi:MAG: hypothetical protein M3O91_08110 [Chloroflexota bacterium]|nr:hypothetical protein [Chloroflexota bacterium]